MSGSRSEASGALHREPSLDRSANLSLSNIRHTLIRQEDTIIYSILERAQVDQIPPYLSFCCYCPIICFVELINDLCDAVSQLPRPPLLTQWLRRSAPVLGSQ